MAPVQEASAAVPAKPANLSPLQLRLKTAATTASKTKVPAWRENVMKSKLNLFYSTQARTLRQALAIPQSPIVVSDKTCT